VLESLRQRDEFDSHRAVAPLRPAEDAIILNSDGMKVEDVLAKALGLVLQRQAQLAA
jgi:cytidylate kinase